MSYTEESTRYAESLMLREPALLRELREATASELLHDDMLSGPVVGGFLNMLVRISGARTVLEVGTFTGYATLWMAMALPPDGLIVTCESNEKYASIARRFFSRCRSEMGLEQEQGLGGRGSTGSESTGPSPGAHGKSNRFHTGTAAIHLLMGPALEAPLPERIDFVFLDADKEYYPEYYRRIKPLLAPGGLMVIDNAFWGGEVWGAGAESGEGDAANGTMPTGRKAVAIDRLNRTIANDPDVENVVLTVRDGLHLVRKIR
jgi:caffeoyl-CoA O-methyltransferase